MNMQRKPEPVIPYDSPEAAQIKTVTGWVSRDGRFLGNDEHTARYFGCTHRPCEDCGALTPVHGFTVCDNGCHQKRMIARYEAMPRAAWDGKAMLYSDARDEYFNDLERALDGLEEGETLADLRLIICKPNYPRRVDEDYWSDDLPTEEDGALPGELLEAVCALNAVIDKLPPLSWYPGKFALDLTGLED